MLLICFVVRLVFLDTSFVNNNNNNNNIYSHIIHIQVSHIVVAKHNEQIYYVVRNSRQ